MWLWSGTHDTTIFHGVENHTNQWYKDMGANVVYVNDMAGEHVFPTDLDRNLHTCLTPGTAEDPGISNCHFDAVGAMFKHIIPNQETNPLSRNLDWA